MDHHIGLWRQLGHLVFRVFTAKSTIVLQLNIKPSSQRKTTPIQVPINSCTCLGQVADRGMRAAHKLMISICLKTASKNYQKHRPHKSKKRILSWLPIFQIFLSKRPNSNDTKASKDNTSSFNNNS